MTFLVPLVETVDGETVTKIVQARLISSRGFGQAADHQEPAEPHFDNGLGVFSSSMAEERSRPFRGWKLFEAKRQINLQFLSRVIREWNEPFFVKLGFPKGERVFLEVHILNFQVQCFAESQPAGVEKEIKSLSTFFLSLKDQTVKAVHNYTGLLTGTISAMNYMKR